MEAGNRCCSDELAMLLPEPFEKAVDKKDAERMSSLHELMYMRDAEPEPNENTVSRSEEVPLVQSPAVIGLLSSLEGVEGGKIEEGPAVRIQDGEGAGPWSKCGKEEERLHPVP